MKKILEFLQIMLITLQYPLPDIELTMLVTSTKGNIREQVKIPAT